MNNWLFQSFNPLHLATVATACGPDSVVSLPGRRLLGRTIGRTRCTRRRTEIKGKTISFLFRLSTATKNEKVGGRYKRRDTTRRHGVVRGQGAGVDGAGGPRARAGTAARSSTRVLLSIRGGGGRRGRDPLPYHRSIRRRPFLSTSLSLFLFPCFFILRLLSISPQIEALQKICKIGKNRQRPR